MSVMCVHMCVSVCACVHAVYVRVSVVCPHAHVCQEQPSSAVCHRSSVHRASVPWALGAQLVGRVAGREASIDQLVVEHCEPLSESPQYWGQ